MRQWSICLVIWLVLLALIIFGCTTFVPVKDSAPTPMDQGVRTLEVEACGHRGVGTVGCVFKQGTDLGNSSITIHVPYTNNLGEASTIQLTSITCGIDRTVAKVAGTAWSIPLKELMGVNTLDDSCEVRIVVVPKWQEQNHLTVPAYPLTGRILLIKSDNPPTPIHLYPSDHPFPSMGFVRVSTRVDRILKRVSAIVVDTQGSSNGKVLFGGCNDALKPVVYTEKNPVIDLPTFASGCVIVGKVIRLDAATDLSFVIAVDVRGPEYLNLREPVISKDRIEFDPNVVIISISGKDQEPEMYFGSVFDLSRKHKKGVWDVKQWTLGGRFSWTRISGGKVLWILE